MRGPAPDKPKDRPDDPYPKEHRNFPDRSDPPVEQRDENNHQRAGNRFLSVLAERMEVGRILRKTDRARGQAERRLYQSLPDEQERHHPAETARTISFPQEYVGAAGKWHRRAEFRPHKTVEKRQHCSRNPRQQRLRPAHGLDDQGNHDKRAGRKRCWRGLRERSEEHTSELQSLAYLVCRLLLEKKKKHKVKSPSR